MSTLFPSRGCTSLLFLLVGRAFATVYGLQHGCVYCTRDRIFRSLPPICCCCSRERPFQTRSPTRPAAGRVRCDGTRTWLVLITWSRMGTSPFLLFPFFFDLYLPVCSCLSESFLSTLRHTKLDRLRPRGHTRDKHQYTERGKSEVPQNRKNEVSPSQKCVVFSPEKKSENLLRYTCIPWTLIVLIKNPQKSLCLTLRSRLST